MKKYINEKALDFNPRGDNVETLSNDHIKLFKIMSDYWTRVSHWTKLFLYILVFLPLPIFLIFNLIRTNEFSNNKYYFYSLLLSCFSPLFLIPIAFDIERWFALFQFITFINIFILCFRINLKFSLKGIFKDISNFICIYVFNVHTTYGPILSYKYSFL